MCVGLHARISDRFFSRRMTCTVYHDIRNQYARLFLSTTLFACSYFPFLTVTTYHKGIGWLTSFLSCTVCTLSCIAHFLHFFIRIYYTMSSKKMDSAFDRSGSATSLTPAMRTSDAN